MSKKKRQQEKIRKEQARQIKRAAKAKREQNNPSKWEEKKAKRQSSQQAVRDSQYPHIPSGCKLILSKLPSPQNCAGCSRLCEYNPSY